MGWNGSQAEQTTAPAMRWWGWGAADRAPMLTAHTIAQLRTQLGVSGPPSPPVALSQVRLQEPRLAAATQAELQRALGADQIASDHAARVQHAAGRGYLDLLRLRSGELEGAPDAVVRVMDHEQALKLLEVCARHSIAVVPFGGGTSVVGGVAPLRGRHEAVISLDMAGIAGVQALDRESLTVTAGAGMRVAALERQLAKRGLTLGHFPQSFEHVSLGGCAATRSAGQASTGYGRFEELVLGLRLATPTGGIELQATPASAAGPDLRELVVGCEGTLGAIDRLTLAVHRRPSTRHYEGWLFGDFESGVAALRRLAQEGLAPAVARLSDRQETELSLRLAGGGLKQQAARVYIGARGYSDGCLAILGFEGEAERVEAIRKGAKRVLGDQRAISLGRSAGEAWLRSRFEAPYLRDELLTHGVMVETLETATVWSGLITLKNAVANAISRALEDCGTPGIVGCHVSHLYESGASLYFTLLARMLRGEAERQWHAVKEAAGAAILANGGTITHHHAIGRDHMRWLGEEIGARGIAALAAVKRQLDPEGIMNPGKLLPLGET
jgi:alkyldihydroxyacetonephosphate synthase